MAKAEAKRYWHDQGAETEEIEITELQGERCFRFVARKRIAASASKHHREGDSAITGHVNAREDRGRLDIQIFDKARIVLRQANAGFGLSSGRKVKPTFGTLRKRTVNFPG